MSIVLSVVSDWNGKAIERAIKEFGNLKTAGEKASLAIDKAALPAAAALAAVGVAAVGAAKAAMEDAAAQSRLAGQLVRSTGATNAVIKANEDYLSSLSMTVAVADDELRPALSSLVTATGNLSKAQQLLGTALDVSASTGIDLQTVSGALAKAYAGNMRGLQALSPEMKKAIQDGADFSDVLAILTDNYGGAAEAAANTAEGGMKKFSIAVSEAQEAVGETLLPILEAILPSLQSFAKWVEKNSLAVVIMVGSMATLAAALVAAKASMVIYNAIVAVTTAFNTALAISFTAVQVATVVGIATAIAGAATLAVLATQIRGATSASDDYTTSANAAAGATNNWYKGIIGLESAARAMDTFWQLVAENEEKKKAAAQKQADAAAALYRKTKDALEKAKQGLRDYASSLADTVRSYISLQSAVAAATSSEEVYQDALKERMAAYEELNRLQKSGLYTTQQMADATERVANAEGNLNSAQAQRKTYSQQFAEQIAAAKKFSGQLQQLIGAGLGKSGLAQLLNLGPVAGSQVAGDLLSGTGGLTVASLNSDLAAIDTAGTALGQTAIAGDMGLLNQASAKRTGNNVTIYVNGGDPQAVVNALRRYMQINGSVPIRVSG
jgi:hypothetical protein